MFLGFIFLFITTARANPWSEVRSPTRDLPAPIGFYSHGCLAGAMRLPLEGTGFQVMRASRRRFYGHPDLIQFIQTLGTELDSRGLSVLVGDLGQPRGGPMPSGHRSHQMGLDVDLWFWSPTHPKPLLSRMDREKLSAPSMLDSKKRVIPSRFTADLVAKLKISAQNPKVERIFINGHLKQYLCSSLPQTDLAWLHKLRPWNGHDEHFHVRIRCPVDATKCEPQESVPEGDGCDEAREWKEIALPESAPIPPPEDCMKILKEDVA